MCPTNSNVDDPNRYRFRGDDYYFRSPTEMWDLFGAEVPDCLIKHTEDRGQMQCETGDGTLLSSGIPLPRARRLNLT